VIELLGADAMRKIQNRTKPTGQLFEGYYVMLSASRPPQQVYENKRVLEKFRATLGEFPPTPELAVQFIASYKNRKTSTRARNVYILKGFYRYSGLGEIPLKIKEPNHLPQYVNKEDIAKLLDAFRAKKSHKKSLERDLCLVETACMSGLRRGELSNLKVKDIFIKGDDSYICVRSGKGDKDRVVPLYWELRDDLAGFIRGKDPEESVFNVAAKTISGKILQWAVKAGVPQLHTHSFRHYFATTLFENRANARAVQQIMGHTSLETTMKYAATSDKGMKETINLLGGKPELRIIQGHADVSTPCVSPLDHLKSKETGPHPNVLEKNAQALPSELKPSLEVTSVPENSASNDLISRPPTNDKKQIQSRTGETDISIVAGAVRLTSYQRLYDEHSRKLTSLVISLIDDIKTCNVKTDIKTKAKANSMFGNLSMVYPSQNQQLWPSLQRHLDNEFNNPPLSEQIVKIAIAEGWAHYLKKESSETQLVNKVLAKLVILSERGSFVETCDVCEGYFFQDSHKH
jgi:integrase/recombinase XerD